MKRIPILIIVGTIIVSSLTLTFYLLGRTQCQYGEFSVGDPPSCEKGIDLVQTDFESCLAQDGLNDALRQGQRHLTCELKKFNPSEKVYEMTRTRIPLCLPGGQNRTFMQELIPSKVERLNGVIFLFSSDFWPEPDHHRYHCAYRVTIDFGQDPNEEQLHFEFGYEDFFIPNPGIRYDALITVPENGKPFAALVYDREFGQLTYLVSNFVY